jgi:hypothetical protein
MTDAELEAKFKNFQGSMDLLQARIAECRDLRNDAIREHAKDHPLRATAKVIGLSHNAVAKIVNEG